MKVFDLVLGSSGKVHIWDKGFFEGCAEMAGNKFNEDDYISIGQFRMKKIQYEDNKEKFDRYMKGLIIK